MGGFEQIKIQVPKSERELLARCKRLSGQRLLSKTFIRLMKDEMRKEKKVEN